MKRGSHHSEETKIKLSLIHTGKVCSEETKIKISAANSGTKNHNYGKTGKKSPHYGKQLSIEHKEKIALAQMGEKNHRYGKIVSQETKIKMSASHSGEKNSMYGKPRTPEVKTKLSIAHLGKHLSDEHKQKIAMGVKGKTGHMRGKHHTEKTKLKMSIAQSGENNAQWEGGKSFEPYCPKWTYDLRRRIRSFFDHRCVICGKSDESDIRKLSCHHVTYDKNACCDGKPVQFAALCISCHAKTNFGKSRWEAMLHRTIDEIYDGRSYWTKKEFQNMDTM
jgi:hypothetical protein